MTDSLNKKCCPECEREIDSDYWPDENTPAFRCVDENCSCHQNVSKCCSAPMRYIDEYLCCTHCGKSTEAVSSEKKCPNCGGDIAVRNPTGKCDHLYYPDNVPTAKLSKEVEVNVCPIHDKTHYCDFKINGGKCECKCTCGMPVDVATPKNSEWEESWEKKFDRNWYECNCNGGWDYGQCHNTSKYGGQKFAQKEIKSFIRSLLQERSQDKDA